MTQRSIFHSRAMFSAAKSTVCQSHLGFSHQQKVWIFINCSCIFVLCVCVCIHAGLMQEPSSVVELKMHGLGVTNKAAFLTFLELWRQKGPRCFYCMCDLLVCRCMIYECASKSKTAHVDSCPFIFSLHNVARSQLKRFNQSETLFINHSTQRWKVHLLKYCTFRGPICSLSGSYLYFLPPR